MQKQKNANTNDIFQRVHFAQTEWVFILTQKFFLACYNEVFSCVARFVVEYEL